MCPLSSKLSNIRALEAINKNLYLLPAFIIDSCRLIFIYIRGTLCGKYAYTPAFVFKTGFEFCCLRYFHEEQRALSECSHINYKFLRVDGLCVWMDIMSAENKVGNTTTAKTLFFPFA